MNTNDRRSSSHEGERTTNRWINSTKRKVGVLVGIALAASLGLVATLLWNGDGGVEAWASLGETGPVPVAATQGHEPYPLVQADADGQVRLPAASFDDYAAHYYTYLVNERPIEFFVLKSSDGVIRVAFNACDVCYRSRLGYRQEGAYMICNNCGNRFPADQINVVRGGCNPSPLDRTLVENELILERSAIELGVVYF